MIRGAILFFLASSLIAQTPTTKPEFEAADVKLNKSGDTRMREQILPGGEVVARNIPVTEMIKLAWDVRDEAISGAPRWASTDRFDVTAKTVPGTPDHDLRLMMQNLLEREFKIQAHIEQRPMDVWAMTVAKGGIKMEKSTAAGKPDCSGGPAAPGSAHADCTNMTMDAVVRNLQRMAPAYIDRAIVDQTGLTGAWNLKLDWVGKQTADDTGGTTIFEALEKQAGLKLEMKKIPMPTVVIDRLEKLAEQ